MSFKFECPHCGQPLNVDQITGAITGTCPKCGNEIAIPAPSEFRPRLQTSGPSLPSRSRFLRGMSYFALIIMTGCAIFIAYWKGSTSNSAGTGQTNDAERERANRIAMIVASGGKMDRFNFAIAAGRLAGAVSELRSNGPSAPVSAAAKYQRVQTLVSELAVLELPDDVRPIWNRYDAAVKVLNQRFISLPTSDGARLLSVLLNGGRFTAHPDSVQSEVEREITEFRTAGKTLGDAQDRYHVQEMLDYINHGN